MPGSKQAWPNSADCWSPAIPLTGMPSAVTPNRPLDGRTSGRHEVGTPRRSHSSSDHWSSVMSYRSVRLAFDGSVACTAPSVSFQSTQLSTVPNARSGFAASTPPSVRSHSSFVPEK